LEVNRVPAIEFELPIYTFQIDFAGHVNNAVYVQWLEIGRTRLLEAAGLPIPDMLTQGSLPILASTEINYKRPLALGDSVRLRMWISELGGATARIEGRFLNGEGELVASASQRGLFVDRETGRPRRLTPDHRAAFEHFLSSGDA
jgi:acyl-CoA thioester hydrolase